MNSTTRRLAAASVAAVLGVGTLLAPVGPAAAADDAGLFGSQDPTFDGVYRQGLAIAGLASADRRVPKPAVKWLIRQQCGNGSFTAYNPAPSTKCAKADPVGYSGQDTNATAMAAMALVAVDRPKQAKAAMKYLRKQQNPDGGFPWFRGGLSDTNSTGLILSAMKAFHPNRVAKKQTRQARTFLQQAQLRCAVDSRRRGMLQFQLGAGVPDALGSAQGAVGLQTTLPVSAAPTAGKRISCAGGTSHGELRAGLLHALADALKRNNGVLYYPRFDDSAPSPDYSATASAVMALRSAEWNRAAARTGLKALKRGAPEFAVMDGETVAGAAGSLLLVADATNSKPTRFGGVDLVTSLLDSRR